MFRCGIDMIFKKNEVYQSEQLDKLGIKEHDSGQIYYRTCMRTVIPIVMALVLLVPITINYAIDAENEVEEDGNMLYFKYDVSCYLSNNTTNDYGIIDTCLLLDVRINLPNGTTVDKTLVSPQEWKEHEGYAADDRFVEASTWTRSYGLWTPPPSYTDEVLVMSAAMTFSFRMNEAWNEDSLWVFHTSASVPECRVTNGCYYMLGMNDSVVDHRTVSIYVSDEPFGPDNSGCDTDFSEASRMAPIELVNGEGWTTARASYSFDYNDIMNKLSNC